MKISKTPSTEQACKWKNKGSWRKFLSGLNRKQAEGEKIKVGIILSIAVLQVRGVESLETASEAIFKFTHAYIKNLP